MLSRRLDTSSDRRLYQIAQSIPCGHSRDGLMRRFAAVWCLCPTASICPAMLLEIKGLCEILRLSQLSAGGANGRFRYSFLNRR